MKKPARKSSASQPPSGKSPTDNRAGRDAAFVRLQLCFFLSGAAGLIDQVVWAKALAQLFGYSAYAVATVLAVFMGGLALGSAIFAKWRPANQTGIALYAWMEFAIALTAFLSLPGIALVRHLYLAAYPHVGGSFALLAIVRFLGAAMVLAAPTLLMGGTLPVLLSGSVRESRDLGIRAGRFYAVNTAGAVAGTLAAGFFLIPRIGLRSTLILAVVLNLIAGFLARRIAQLPAIPGRASLTQLSPHENQRGTAESSKFYLLVFAGVGATAIAYELGWTRLLATPLGSSTYAFTTMLATFLLGIAVGSAIFEKWFRKKRNATVGVFAATQLAIGAATLFSLWVHRAIPDFLLFLLRTFGENFTSLFLAQALTSGLALLPATILFGFTFPAVLALLSDSGRTAGETHLSSGVGRAVAANTLGAIFAAIVVGFFLLPRIGSFRLVALAACVNLLLGVLLFLSASRRRWKPLATAAALLVGLGWTAWSPAFFSKASAAFGVVLYHTYHSPALTAREIADTEDVLFFKDGINATIAVTRSANYIALKTNGKVDASNLDSGTQLLLGDLGAVFHPHPRKILIIGLGGGMTASAVSRFPEVERIDCVEIEPGVLEAASHLERLHRSVLSDPRLHLYFDDARNFLQTSRELYDVIISEPSNPWIAGIASLYTEEFFAVVRSHLATGGNFVQWIQAYGLKFDDFAMILSGIDRQFPDLSLWRSSGRDFLVLARTTSEPLSFDRSRALWANKLLREDFEALHLTQPESWPAYFRLGRAAIRRLADRAPRNTDDRTLLEYTAPENLLKDSLTEELEKAIAVFEQGPLPDDLAKQDVQAAALAAAETVLESNPARAARFLKLIPESADSPEARLITARAKIAETQFSEAARDLERLSGSGEDNRFNARYWLVMALRGSGRHGEAESALDGLLADQPNNARALESKVSLASDRNDWLPAIEAQVRLAALRRDSAAAQCRLGDLYLRSRNLAAAREPLLRGLELDPYAFLCHRELGELYRTTGRTTDAIRELEWVVRYFPEGDSKTYLSLALAYRALDLGLKAKSAIEKGKRIFPDDALLERFSISQR